MDGRASRNCGVPTIYEAFYVYVYWQAWVLVSAERCPSKAALAADLAEPSAKSSILVMPALFRRSKPKPTFAHNRRYSNRGVDCAFPDRSGQLARWPLPRALPDRSPPGFSTVAIRYATGVHQLPCSATSF